MNALLAGLKTGSTPPSYGSFGTGSTGHIFGELLKASAGVDLPHVPYRGEGPMLFDLISGRVTTGFVSSATAAARYKDRSLRIFAVTGPHRLASLPEVPTLTESGLQGYDLVGWCGLFLPKGAPAVVLQKIAADARSVIGQSDIAARLRVLEIEPTGTTPADFARLLRNDHARGDALIKTFRIELE
ncbi:tripartite tricarboxylate transporter substrate-binding protein [Pseudorhodoferax sp. LjRoot39]|uniref:tripartite tricarboxylate transporter substrate-binding protein n=1 Tax=Pseudorhodoferax sp. LjRoot39 TaxID=3342328 RepID=UPI003ECDDD5F